MDLWMMHESRSAELKQAERERQIRCALSDGRCWRHRIALSCGVLLLRFARRLIAYGRTQAPPAMSAPPRI